jgi:FkbM family methyltransferase
MKYLTKTNIQKIRDQYDYVIAWGHSDTYMEQYYNPLMYKLDYVINGLGQHVGEYVSGNKISSPEVIKDIPKDSKVLIILFANVESIIYPQIAEAMGEIEYDSIMSKLVCTNENEANLSFSTSFEDVRVKEILARLQIDKPFYMDIGVCHPAANNNTFTFYGTGRGVLVEPNPVMAELIREYRPNDTLINAGATDGEDGKLTYVSYPLRPGHNHFLRDGETFGENDSFKADLIDIPVKNINGILEGVHAEELDFLSVDIEGLDYQVMKSIDTEKFRVKVICIEYAGSPYGQWMFKKLMQEKGYVHYWSTWENHIYVREDLFFDKVCLR